MTLRDFGYTESIESLWTETGITGFEIGRVIAEHKERYIVMTEGGESEAEITGNLRYSASGREDFPAVGDWVALATYDSGLSIIHKILPRSSVISRKAINRPGEVQIIAANIDFALLVQAADRDFNINRLERYLTICHSAGVKPIIVLTKTDLVTVLEKDDLVNKIKRRIRDIPVLPVSNETRDGYDALRMIIEKGRTYCMLGSSGVGKSTLLNNLSGKSLMRTDSISLSTGKGRHVTSHRELIVMENGGILVDNPGMREVGIADAPDGMEVTFDMIFELAQKCKFKDCTHTTETGCAVLEAIGKEELDSGLLENFHKMQREKSFFETSATERKRKEKILGKILKDYKKKNVKGKNQSY